MQNLSIFVQSFGFILCVALTFNVIKLIINQIKSI